MTAREITLLIFTILLISCSNKKLIKYEFKNTEIELNWFYYSYLTNTSSDFIEVKCGDSFINIFESKHGLQKVNVDDKKIIISHLKFNGTQPELKRTENICGYEIEYIEVSSHENYKEYMNKKSAENK